MNLRACVEYLEELTQQTPSHADCWNQLGLLQAQVGQLGDAVASFDRAVGINPGYVEARISRCFAEVELGHSARGFRELRRLLTTNPDDFNAILPLGIFCMRFGWKDAGAAQLLRAERMRPNVPYVLAYSAAAQLEIGNVSGAEQRIGRALKIVRDLKFEDMFAGLPANLTDLKFYGKWRNPLLQSLATISANVDRANGFPDVAMETLIHANARYPGHADLMLAAGRHLLGMDNLESAQRWLTAAILMDDYCHQGYYELSFLHKAVGNADRSRQALEAAVSLRPLFPDYRYQLGVTLLDLEDIDGAIEQLERVRLLHPTFGHCSLHLAAAYLEKQSPAQALDALSTPAVRGWTEALILAAHAHIDCEDRQRASECLQEVLDREPNHDEARELMVSASTTA